MLIAFSYLRGISRLLGIATMILCEKMANHEVQSCAEGLMQTRLSKLSAIPAEIFAMGHHLN